MGTYRKVRDIAQCAATVRVLCYLLVLSVPTLGREDTQLS